MRKIILLVLLTFLTACGSGSSSGGNTGVVVPATTGNYTGTYCNDAAPASRITITKDSGENGWQGTLGSYPVMGLWNDDNASIYNVGDVVIYKLENGYIRAIYKPWGGVVYTSEYGKC